MTNFTIQTIISNGEVWGQDLKDSNGSLVALNWDKAHNNTQLTLRFCNLKREDVPDFLRHLQAWVDTGSFELKEKA